MRTHPLNVNPPFYKGLSLGEIALLSLFFSTTLGLLGALLWMLTGVVMCVVAGAMIGATGVFVLPKSLIRLISKVKHRHCQHYFAMRWASLFHPPMPSQKMASQRIENES